MYVGGQIYWVYLNKAKTRVLVLERNGESYKVAKVCQTLSKFTDSFHIGHINGSDHAYRVVIEYPFEICSSAFISHIQDLAPDVFQLIYEKFCEHRAEKRANRRKKTSTVTTVTNRKKKRNDVPRNAYHGLKAPGPARQKWLPPGNTRIKVFHG